MHLPMRRFASAARPLTRAGIFVFTAVICLWGAGAMAADGLTTLPSNSGPRETMNRLEAEVKAKGMTVFARIDHAAGAAGAGLSMRPTLVLIFGNAKVGTPLMQSVATMAIDLPLKALVWQDAAGTTWLSYNDPSWLAKRHGLGHEFDAAVGAGPREPRAVTPDSCIFHKGRRDHSRGAVRS